MPLPWLCALTERTIFLPPTPEERKAPVSKKTTPIQDSAAGLHTPEAERIEREQMKANRAEAPDQRSESGSVPETALPEAVVPKASQSSAAKNTATNADPKGCLIDFRRKLQDTRKEEKHRDHAPIKKGNLTKAIHLEAGQDKVLINHRKMTNKIRNLLNRIEAEWLYLDSITQKVTKKKNHLGVVIDFPKRKKN